MGIGAAYGRRIAAAGLDVVLAADEPRSLKEVAEEIRGRYGVRVEEVVADLGEVEGLQRLREATATLEVGLLVYNAAIAFVGEALAQDEASRLRQLDVNCRAPLVLTASYAEAMVQRGRGGIVLMSSMSGLHGFPGVTSYAATKAFDLVLAEGLWGELSPHGVDVLAVCAGPTDTPGLASTRPRFGRLSPRVMSPDEVVGEALAALGQRPTVVPGRANRASAWFLQRVLPRAWAVRLVASNLRRIYPEQLR